MIVTWILGLATFGVVTSIAVACRRARREAEAHVCDCLQAVDGYRPRAGGWPAMSPATDDEDDGPTETDAAVQASPTAHRPPACPVGGGERAARRHLRLVSA